MTTGKGSGDARDEFVTKRELELSVQRETQRAFREDSEQYREWLQRTARIVAYLFGVVTAVVLGGGAFVFGSSLSDIRQGAERRVDSAMALVQAEVAEKIIDYKTTAAIQGEINRKMQESVEARVSSDATQQAISDKIREHVGEAVRLRLAALIDAETAKAKAELAAMGTAGLQEAILRTVPIGTVVAWPGAFPPENWAICDGRTFTDAEARVGGWNVEMLRRVLGAPGKNPYGDDRLPDYRGYFLRGQISPGDGPLARAANEARTPPTGGIGSTQDWATGKPRETPEDTIRIASDGVSVRNDGDRIVPALTGGQTAATNQGKPRALVWGSESRPANVYVNWIIKVK